MQLCCSFVASRALQCVCLLPSVLLATMLSPLAYGQAQLARLQDNIVYLPIVDDYPTLYSMELRLESGSLPIAFTVLKADKPQTTLTPSSPYYDGNILVIPDVRIDGISYWADLRELSADRFVLDAYGRNRYQPEFPYNNDYPHAGWERLSGKAKDIGVGADGTVWAVGASDYYGNSGLYHWDGRSWWQDSGSAERVDVDPFGDPWVINSYNEIYRMSRGSWQRVAGAARDIGVGADGSVWVIGTNKRTGGYSIYKRSNNGWQKVEGAGVRIDVEPNGTPWVINEDDQIYRLENGSWRRIPGLATDIGIGADGSVWVVGTDERAGGYGLYRYNGSSWDKMQGSARQVSVAPNGTPWVVNLQGEIYRGLGK